LAGNPLAPVSFENVFDIEITSSVANETNSATGWSVYPNPVISGQTLRINTNDDDSGSLRITDPTGRLIYQNKINHVNTIDISTNSWSSGMYIMRWSSEKGDSMHQLIIE